MFEIDELFYVRDFSLYPFMNYFINPYCPISSLLERSVPSERDEYSASLLFFPWEINEALSELPSD